MEIFIFILVLWYGGLFFQSFFLHRYSAHQVFTMSKTMERITFVLTWVFQGPSYLSLWLRNYAPMHHAFTDTEKDPHSPSHDASLFAMMWKTKTIYHDINEQRIEVDQRFVKNVPQWKSFDRELQVLNLSRIFWILSYINILYFFCNIMVAMVIISYNIFNGSNSWCLSTGLVTYGYENYKMKNTSKNLFPFDFLMMGEGYHNNHHKYSSNANFGSKMA